MLREIAINEITDYEPEQVLVIHEDTVYRLDEFQEGFRFLIDEIPAEDDPEEEAEEEASKPKRKRTREEIVGLILNAVSDGKNTVPEIVDATGLDYKTAKKYLKELEAV